MYTLHQLREGLNGAWETMVDGWQRLYRRASGAITRFGTGEKDGRPGAAGAGRDLAVRSVGWGVLAAEVFDDDDSIVVRLEVPGMEKGDFDLQVVDNVLVVRGEKQIEREHTQGRYSVTECAYGVFKRVIPLPEGAQGGKAHANYRNGVLRIELPKAASKRRKTIKVDLQ